MEKQQKLYASVRKTTHNTQNICSHVNKFIEIPIIKYNSINCLTNFHAF